MFRTLHVHVLYKLSLYLQPRHNNYIPKSVPFNISWCCKKLDDRNVMCEEKLTLNYPPITSHSEMGLVCLATQADLQLHGFPFSFLPQNEINIKRSPSCSSYYTRMPIHSLLTYLSFLLNKTKLHKKMLLLYFLLHL